ncbi:MAG: hypothetical protein WC652_07000, partial [archaeon]
MPIFAFRGEENKKDLDELKRLATGNESNNFPTPPEKKENPPTSQNNNNQLKKDLEMFKEEQRIFTQVTNVKELSGNQDYQIPTDLTHLLQKPETPQTAPTQPTLQKIQTTPTSAFDKLMELKTSQVKENLAKESISTTIPIKPSYTPEKMEEKTDSNARTISLQNSAEKNPVIVQKEQTPVTTPEKENIGKFNWESEENTEEPIETDFKEDEDAQTSESHFAKQKLIL